MKVYHLIEEEGSACGAREARGDEFGAVGEWRVTAGTREEARAAQMVQEDAPHGLVLWDPSTVRRKKHKALRQIRY